METRLGLLILVNVLIMKKKNVLGLEKMFRCERCNTKYCISGGFFITGGNQ